MAKTKTPSLADAFAEGPEPLMKGPRCSVGQLLVALPPTDAEIVRQALSDPAWTNKRIAERLQAAGHRITAPAVARHSRGECLCASLGFA